MEDYRTRRLDAGSEEPKPEEEAQEEEAPMWGTPPPLPVEEREAPPPLPMAEDKDETPPALPKEEAVGSPKVFYQAPPEPQRSVGETVVSPASWYSQEQAVEPEVPSPFEEPEVTPEPVTPRPITPEPITPSRGGGAQSASSSGSGTPAKKDNKKLLIAIVVGVLLLLCCCCIIAIAAFFATEGFEELGWLGATLANLLL